MFVVSDTVEETLAEVGRRIASLRLSMNLSQQELALRSGVSKRSLERLEQGVGNLQLKAFLSICSALRLTPGLEALLPPVELTPQQLFNRQRIRKRARKRNGAQVTTIWGSDE
ncbi:MAG: helix-turn-helix transcriptional regulator [Kiritimatiellae bacterium]|nr:helix-turn-helix transcriptional regulator [Kiritimatiellia bacterium]